MCGRISSPADCVPNQSRTALEKRSHMIHRFRGSPSIAPVPAGVHYSRCFARTRETHFLRENAVSRYHLSRGLVLMRRATDFVKSLAHLKKPMATQITCLMACLAPTRGQNCGCRGCRAIWQTCSTRRERILNDLKFAGAVT